MSRRGGFPHASFDVVDDLSESIEEFTEVMAITPGYDDLLHFPCCLCERWIAIEFSVPRQVVHESSHTDEVCHLHRGTELSDLPN